MVKISSAFRAAEDWEYRFTAKEEDGCTVGLESLEASSFSVEVLLHFVVTFCQRPNYIYEYAKFVFRKLMTVSCWNFTMLPFHRLRFVSSMRSIGKNRTFRSLSVTDWMTIKKGYVKGIS